MVEPYGGETRLGVVVEDELRLVEIFAECTGVEVFDVIIVRKLGKFTFATFDGVKKRGKHKAKSNHEGRGADKRHEGDLAPAEGAALGGFAMRLGFITKGARELLCGFGERFGGLDGGLLDFRGDSFDGMSNFCARGVGLGLRRGGLRKRPVFAKIDSFVATFLHKLIITLMFEKL